MGDTIDVYIVSAISLESLRRNPTDARPLDFHFDRMTEAEKPAPTELCRCFSMKDAEHFKARLHPSWFRPSIEHVVESMRSQHAAHGGERGK